MRACRARPPLYRNNCGKRKISSCTLARDMLNLLLGGIRAAQRDVVRYGVGKKERCLANYRQAATPAIEL